MLFVFILNCSRGSIITLNDIWYVTISKGCSCIGRRYIALVSDTLRNRSMPVKTVFKSFHDWGYLSMVRRALSNLEVCYEMAFIDSSLNIIVNTKTLILLHQPCVLVSKRHLGLTGLLHLGAIIIIFIQPLLAGIKLLLKFFFAELALIVLLSIFFIKKRHVVIHVFLKTLDSVVKFS